MTSSITNAATAELAPLEDDAVAVPAKASGVPIGK
jgi:hypothetical protein